jgi:hypothetical protein
MEHAEGQGGDRIADAAAGGLAGWTGLQPLDQNLHFVFGNQTTSCML